MANIGNFGEISFYCMSVNGKNQMLSFQELTRNSSATFSEHERNNEKAYLEFGGNGLDTLTLLIVADARYGIKPLDVQQKLYKKKAAGQAENFVVGGKKVGDNPFVITEIVEQFKTLYTDGRPIRIDFQITLKEYANKVAEITTIPAARQIGNGMQTAVKTCNDMYTVVKGDCLWNISKKFYGSGAQYTKIYNANKTVIGGNPNLIYPGQVLSIPK